jgi:cardiolipin synthase
LHVVHTRVHRRYNPAVRYRKPDRPTGTEPYDARVYFTGRSLYDDMLVDIARAERDICLEMYIFDDDAVGRRFHDSLVQRATAGCRVRLMHDGLGCLNTPAHFFDSMRRAGVEVAAFSPIARERVLHHWRKLDRRDHRKLLVVDERVAYLGGINISARLEDWEDAHVRLEGPIARQARVSFEKVWAGQFPHITFRRGKRRPLHSQRSLILDGFPAPHFSPIKRAHLHLFSRARRRIRIAHAYLIPDHKTIRTLRKAVRRGVDVNVLVPAHSDVSLADWALRHVMGRLLRAGVQVRCQREPMLHAKTSIADDRYVIVGSANLNRTSFFRNLEIALWSRDERIIEPAAERFDLLWDKALPYTLADVQRRGRPRRFLSWLAYRLQFWLPTDQAW